MKEEAERGRGGEKGERRFLTQKEYESRNKPYRPVDHAKTRVPTIGEQWAYAARRYSKYQGYAWSGVVAVGGLAFLLSTVMDSDKGQSQQQQEKK
jgi:hypothetical protein